MYKPWSELPNSHHIDWVIESVKKDTQLWQAARIAAWYAAREPHRSAAGAAARGAARSMGLGVVWDMARKAVWDMAQDATLYSARSLTEAASFRIASATAAGTSVLALVAYDDCDQYINMGYEKLQVYAALSEKPQAVLLLPMVYVREKVNETEIY